MSPGNRSKVSFGGDSQNINEKNEMMNFVRRSAADYNMVLSKQELESTGSP